QPIERQRRHNSAEIGKALRSALRQSGGAKQTAKVRLAAVLPARAVAGHVVLGRERLDERDAAVRSAKLASNRAEAASNVARGDLLHPIRAHDEIERARQPHVAECPNRAASNVSSFPKALDGVLARLDADIPDAGTNASQHRIPRALAASDVEHRPNATTNH